MSVPRNSTRPISRPIFRATFSGLKVRQFGMEKILNCEMDVELRPLSRRSELYGVFSMVTNARLQGHGFCLREAKSAAAAMFEKQLTEWEETRVCLSR
jgi:hypothetical protein